MRYLIASDIHGSFENIKKILFNNKFDILILLGDILNGPYDIDTMNKTADLLNIFKNKIIYVKGNCDTYLNAKLEFYNNDLYRYILIDKKTCTCYDYLEEILPILNQQEERIKELERKK